MDVRSSTRRWPVLALVVTTFACADQSDTEVDSEIDAVPPAAETTPPTTTGMLTEADVVQAVTAVNQTEIDEAELAREKSENEQVRQFAEMMITDHTRLLDEVRQGTTMGTPGVTDTMAAGTGTQSPDVAAGTPPTQPPTGAGVQGSAVIQQLQQDAQQARSQLEGLTGAEFDQAYIARQVEAHQRALDLIDSQLLPSTQDPTLRQQLESARPVIEQHLQRAQEIQQQLGTATGAPGGADTPGTADASGRTA